MLTNLQRLFGLIWCRKIASRCLAAKGCAFSNDAFIEHKANPPDSKLDQLDVALDCANMEDKYCQPRFQSICGSSSNRNGLGPPYSSQTKTLSTLVWR